MNASDFEPGTLGLQVHAIRMQAIGIHSYEFVHPENEDLPKVHAGAHVDVHLPGGLVRSYSLAGDPQDRKRWVLGVLREVNGRGGSRTMHDKIRVGDVVQIGHPRNAFELTQHTGHTILLGGGIGITPIKAMAHELVAQGKSFELHYCAKSPKHAAFLSELENIAAPGNIYLHYDNGEPGRGLDIAALLSKTDGQTHLYYCGPSGFMKACDQASQHWPAGTVHSEHFKAPEKPASTEVPDGFELKLAKQGLTIQVARDQTIVRAIELAGFRVPTSCLSGLCGACKVEYLEGEVEHCDYILTDEEKKHCLTTCVSRARSATLVLDL